jgi:hypothetical protein
MPAVATPRHQKPGCFVTALAFGVLLGLVGVLM